MDIMIMGFNVFPPIIFTLVLFLVVRIFIIPINYKKAKTSIAFCISGFIGFFITFPLPFHDPFFYNYFLVPLSFFTCAVLGTISCLHANVNPLYPKLELFDRRMKEEMRKRAKIDRLQQIEELEQLAVENKTRVTALSNYFQSEKESLKLINKTLLQLGTPFSFTRNISIKYGDEKLKYLFIVTGPNAVFHFYPCNWSGDVTFSSTSALREITTPYDTKDYIIPSTYREQLLKNMLHSIGLEKVPVRTVIVTTNPYINAFGKNSSYDVVNVNELHDYIKNYKKGSLMNNTELFDVQTLLDSFTVHNEN